MIKRKTGKELGLHAVDVAGEKPNIQIKTA